MEKFSWWKWILLTLGFSVSVELFFVFWNQQRNIAFATESAAWGGEALTGLVAFLILIGFIYERYKTRSAAALEEVKFFLEEIGALYQEITAIVYERYPDKTPEELLELKPSIARIESFNFSWVIENAPKETKAQSNFQSDPKNREILLKNQSLINHLEYLALHIKEKGTLNEPALNSIKQSFVEAVENNVITILSLMISTSDYYANIRWLYFKWYKSVKRQTIEDKKNAVREAFEVGVAKLKAAHSRGKNSEGK